VLNSFRFSIRFSSVIRPSLTNASPKKNIFFLLVCEKLFYLRFCQIAALEGYLSEFFAGLFLDDEDLFDVVGREPPSIHGKFSDLQVGFLLQHSRLEDLFKVYQAFFEKVLTEK
jgi:hypothetical protein